MNDVYLLRCQFMFSVLVGFILLPFVCSQCLSSISRSIFCCVMCVCMHEALTNWFPWHLFWLRLCDFKFKTLHYCRSFQKSVFFLENQNQLFSGERFLFWFSAFHTNKAEYTHSCDGYAWPRFAWKFMKT